MPSWAGVNVDAFLAGFGICEGAMVIVLVFALSVWMLKRLFSAAGL